jgi:molybdopterin converting factor small subunit
MIVRVKLFARARDLVGADVVQVELPSGATVADLREALIRQVQPLTNFVPRCAIAQDGEYALDPDDISAQADLALIPPVSGG